MSPVRTERFPKTRFGVFAGKAEEFSWSMMSTLSAGKPNAAASAAAHCVTNACDALVAYHLGLRCKGQDHREIVALLAGLPIPSVADHQRQILTVLDLKAAAEYEGRDVTLGEARAATERAARVLRWARQNLPSRTMPVR